jgi:hypothetical protein
MGIVTGTIALLTAPIWIPLAIFIIFHPITWLLMPLLLLLGLLTSPIWIPLLLLAIII